MKKLYMNDNGMLSCQEHIGSYASAELERKPNARHIRTPLDTWTLLSESDSEQLAQMVGRRCDCETCEAIARNQEVK